jgi:outer membrane protein assembly factor BamB
LALVVTLCAAPGLRADWPSVRGDAALSGRADTAVPAKPIVRWTFEGGSAFHGVAIVGEVAVATEASGTVHAITLADGKPRWRAELGVELEAPPTIDGGRVYIGDLDGTLHALDLADGRKLWTFATDGEIHAGVTATPACLLIGSHDATVRCLDRNGKERWKVETDNFVNAAVAVSGELVWVAGCDGFLRGLELENGRERHTVALGGYVGASPAIGGKRAIVGTFENEVLGIDLSKATVAWRWSDPEKSFPFASSPATDGKLGYLGGRDRRVHAFDLASGALQWSWNAGARVDASPLLAGPHLVVATDRGKLAVLEASSGRELSAVELGGTLTSPAAAAGLIVIGSSDGLLYALGASK